MAKIKQPPRPNGLSRGVVVLNVVLNLSWLLFFSLHLQHFEDYDLVCVQSIIKI